ncbi:uncharacterized protein LOC127566225 [Drosophila albomicans]|uniref:Uncharacterized protein LOC127566225 n=1 Tax=Drosophila albomicans TaxID=7291 RepID=A0A9C6T3Z0_DROAB|nr:uncharacterized protein LOC127566225 [Drosophila albomicans]
MNPLESVNGNVNNYHTSEDAIPSTTDSAVAAVRQQQQPRASNGNCNDCNYNGNENNNKVALGTTEQRRRQNNEQSLHQAATAPSLPTFFVHIVMYFYYMIAAMEPKYQKFRDHLSTISTSQIRECPVVSDDATTNRNRLDLEL